MTNMFKHNEPDTRCGDKPRSTGSKVDNEGRRRHLKLWALLWPSMAIGQCVTASHLTKKPSRNGGKIHPKGSASQQELPDPGLHRVVLGALPSPREKFEEKEEFVLEKDDPLTVDICDECFGDRVLSEQYARAVTSELSIFANLFTGEGEQSYRETAREFFRQLRVCADRIGAPLEVVANILLMGARNSSEFGEDGTRRIIPRTNGDIEISGFQMRSVELIRQQRTQDVFRAWIAGYYRDDKRPEAFHDDTRHLRLLRFLGRDPHRYEQKLPMLVWEVCRWFTPTSLLMDSRTLTHAEGILRNPELFSSDYPEVLQVCEEMGEARDRLETSREEFEIATREYVDQHYQEIFDALHNPKDVSLWESVGLTDPPSPFQVANYTEYWRQYNRLGALRNHFLDDELVDTELYPGTLDHPSKSAAARELAGLLGLMNLLQDEPDEFVARIRAEDSVSLGCTGTRRYFREDPWKRQRDDLSENSKKRAVVWAFVKDQILNPGFLEYIGSRGVAKASKHFCRVGKQYKDREMKAYKLISHREHDMSFQIRVNTASIAAKLDTVQDYWGPMNLRQRTKFADAKEIALYVLGTALLFEVPSGTLIARGTIFAKNPFFDQLCDPEAMLPPMKAFIERYNELQKRGVSQQLHSDSMLLASDPEAGFRSPRTLLSGRMSAFTPSLLSDNGPLYQLTSRGGWKSLDEGPPNMIGRTAVSDSELRELRRLVRAFDEPPDFYSGLAYGQSIAHRYLLEMLQELVVERNTGRQPSSPNDP